MSERHTIYGSRLSYFTRKLEVALEMYGVPFQMRPVKVAERDAMKQRSGTHLVPVLETPDGQWLHDTTPLIDRFDALLPQRRLFPPGPLGALVQVVEEWLDEWLTRTALHYRWDYPDATADASKVLAHEMAGEGVDASAVEMLRQMMVGWGKKAVRANGFRDNPNAQRSAEREYAELLSALDTQLSQTRYSLGDRPTAVDATLLGGLRAHFDVDSSIRPLVGQFAHVKAWLDSAVPWDGAGELAPFPESTPFAQHCLRAILPGYKPFALAIQDTLASGGKVAAVNVLGDDVTVLARPTVETSRQRAIGRMARLPAHERTQVLSWLESQDLLDLFGPKDT